jgi:hypothetical protein
MLSRQRTCHPSIIHQLDTKGKRLACMWETQQPLTYTCGGRIACAEDDFDRQTNVLEFAETKCSPINSQDET